MNRVISSLAALVLASPALAASGAAPLIQPRELAAGAAAANLGWSGPSSNVQSTGLQGIDGSQFFIYHAPSTVGDAGHASLRVQRSGNYSGGTSGATVGAIWAPDFTSPTGLFYEWALLGELHNQTDAAMAAQNIAVNGTAFKQFASGYAYSLAPQAEVGATWGGNFVCNDLTGVVNPWNACIGTEIDDYFKSGVGPDPHNSRVVLQLAWGSGGSPVTLATDHIGTGILIGGNGAATMDNAVKFGGGGAYGVGLNFAGASFNIAPILMGEGQKLVFDGTTTGTYNWALSDIAGTMALQYGGVNAVTVDSAGNIVAGSLNTGGGVTAAGVTSTGDVTGVTVHGGTVYAGLVSLGGGWTWSNISGTMALQYDGANMMTVDNTGGLFVIGNYGSAAGVTINGPLRTGGYTVATLNEYGAPGIGMRAYVIDATSCTLNGALTGGGSTACPAWYNGAAWVGGG